MSDIPNLYSVSSWENIARDFEHSQIFKAISCQKKEIKLELANAVLAGKCFNRDGSDEEKSNFYNLFHEWLRWVLSDEPSTNAWWHWIAEKKDDDIRDRDRYIIELWHSMGNGVNQFVKLQITANLTSWSYYQNFFFNWFLNRFNIVNARAVFNNNLFSRFFHIPLVIWILVCVAWFFQFSDQTRLDWLLSITGVLMGFTVSNALAWIKPVYFLQSLIPRLAVTTGIGYLFLLSVPDLLKTIYRSSQLVSIEWEIGIFAGFILIVFFYMSQVLQRRIRPRLSLWRTYARAGHLLIVGIAYSAIGLLLTVPVIFNTPFLDPQFLKDNSPNNPMYLLITAAIALVLGTILQLVWDDKPVTEPL